MKTGLQLGDGPVRAVGRRRRRPDRRAHEEGRHAGRANVEKLLASGKTTWYADDASVASGRNYFDIATGDYKPQEVPAGVWSVTVAKKAERRGEEECRRFAHRSR